jgi:hypothetical protein
MADINVIDFLMLGLLLVAAGLLWRMRGQQERTDMRNDEQNRQFQNMDKKLGEARDAQLVSLADMQINFEQRFGEMQHGI